MEGGQGGRGQNGGGIKWIGIALVAAVLLRITGVSFSGNDVMKVVKTVALGMIICFTVLLAIVIFVAWWEKRKEQKNKEAEQAIQILNAPLETFADLETQQLMDKYDGKKPEEKTAQDNSNNGKKNVNPYSASANPYGEGEMRQSH